MLDAYMSTAAKKTVYIPMCADIVHPGHLNIIEVGSKLGDVTIGLLTDEAVASKKRLPLMNYEQRAAVVGSIKGVVAVVPQETSDYRPNLNMLCPDFVVHGNDWSESARQQVTDTLDSWGGQLIEVEYTEGISSTALHEKIRKIGVSPGERMAKLSRLLKTKQMVRILEAHNGMSALIVENTRVKDAKKHVKEFDALWVSSLTDSAAKGLPDTELVDRSSRLATIHQILDVTTKPILVDGDTGGNTEQFVHTVRSLERIGVSGVVIEDKKGHKRNSLHDDSRVHEQEDIEVFADKIKAGLDARIDERFLVIARIESLIVSGDQQDALQRARAYCVAGASAIMIHSKDPSGHDVQSFCQSYAALEYKKPLMLVPTSYYRTKEAVLVDWGANIIVYANHQLRAAYPAMQAAAISLLENESAEELEKSLIPIADLLKVVEKDD